MMILIKKIRKRKATNGWAGRVESRLTQPFRFLTALIHHPLVSFYIYIYVCKILNALIKQAIEIKSKHLISSTILDHTVRARGTSSSLVGVYVSLKLFLGLIGHVIIIIIIHR